jgi:hypothetical protein
MSATPALCALLMRLQSARGPRGSPPPSALHAAIERLTPRAGGARRRAAPGVAGLALLPLLGRGCCPTSARTI